MRFDSIRWEQEGHKHLSGLDEAVIRNIEACKQLSKITRTSLGPNGMNKMVINHLERLFVTSDAAVIVRELEVAHPAARLLVMAAQSQEREMGDGTNLVVSFGGELLGLAEELVREGLHPSEIVEGYEKAAAKALEWMGELVVENSDVLDARDVDAVAGRIKGTLSSKQHGFEEKLARVVASACVDVLPKNALNFNVDNVRTTKIPGSSLSDCTVVQGMVIRRGVEGTIRSLKNVKIAVFGCAVDTSTTETKGTVLIKSASELEAYSKGEEAKMEEYIKGIADAGARVVVTGQSFGEMALHFIERYGLMAIKIPSKFELRRLCRATNARGLVKLDRPEADELGFVSSIEVREIGGTQCVVVSQDDHTSRVATVVLRGSTQSAIDDMERAVDDGVNAFKALTKDSRTVPAGGATEIELAHRLAAYGRKQTGLDQYAIQKFAQALEVVPRTLAENAGVNATDCVYNLYAAHANGDVNAGVDITGENTSTDLGATQGIYDVFLVKYWALKYAVDAVCTVLRVDTIIMSKFAGAAAGGAPPPGQEE
jgi:T-complex protein 1 subunit theta|tara:strand:- start:803 stop:2428 length:1626 start_codon:yes stop_codon:yes gene_type:complete